MKGSVSGIAIGTVLSCGLGAARSAAPPEPVTSRAQVCEERWLDNSGRPSQSPYKNLVELTGLIVDGSAAANRASLAALEPRLLDFVRRYPEFAEGLAFVGGMETVLGNHDVAIPLLEKAFGIAPPKMSRAGLFRNAAVSYAAVGQYEKAFDAAGAAVSDNRGVTADPEFMYAAIKTQAALGMFAEAETSARVLMAKEPRVKDDPEFSEVKAFVRDRIKNAGK